MISKEFKEKVEHQSLIRGDSWGRQVLSRICTVDLEREGAVYHFSCWVKFYREEEGSSTQFGRKPSTEINQAMQEIYQYMEDSDECQFSLKSLHDLVDNKYTISEVTVKRKLIEHYGDHITITATQKKVPVVCFRNQCNQILSDHWYIKKRKMRRKKKYASWRKLVKLQENIL